MSVSYWEVEDSKYGSFPKEEWENGFLEATRLLKCAWADRHTLLTELAWEKYPYVTTTDAYPYAATVEGFGERDGTGPIAEYDSAYVRVRYTNKLVISNSLLVTEELHPYSLHLPIDPRGFCWTSKTGTPIMPNEAPSNIVRSSQYLITYYRVTSVPAAATSYVDCCNSGTLNSISLGRSFAAGTLLFGGATSSLDIRFASTPKLRLTYRFLIHPANWNKYWRPATMSWETMYHTGAAGTGAYVQYTPVDFSALVPT